jgi:hypothetical protein
LPDAIFIYYRNAVPDAIFIYYRNAVAGLRAAEIL